MKNNLVHWEVSRVYKYADSGGQNEKPGLNSDVDIFCVQSARPKAAKIDKGPCRHAGIS